jgi:hypothetical protein
VASDTDVANERDAGTGYMVADDFTKASLKFKIGEVVGAIRTIDHDRIDKMYEDAIVQMSTGNPSVSIPAALRRASHNLNIMGGRPGCRHYAAQTLAKITDAAFNAAKHHKAAGTL